MQGGERLQTRHVRGTENGGHAALANKREMGCPPTRPRADPGGETREGGPAPGLWEDLSVHPSRVFELRV